jgi:hypothetical protein
MARRNEAGPAHRHNCFMRPDGDRYLRPDRQRYLRPDPKLYLTPRVTGRGGGTTGSTFQTASMTRCLRRNVSSCFG